MSKKTLCKLRSVLYLSVFSSAGAMRKAQGVLWPLVKGLGMLMGASSSLLPLKLVPHSGHSSGTKKQKISLSQWLNLTTLLSIEDVHWEPLTARSALSHLSLHSGSRTTADMEANRCVSAVWRRLIICNAPIKLHPTLHLWSSAVCTATCNEHLMLNFLQVNTSRCTDCFYHNTFLPSLNNMMCELEGETMSIYKQVNFK